MSSLTKLHATASVLKAARDEVSDMRYNMALSFTERQQRRERYQRALTAHAHACAPFAQPAGPGRRT